MEDFKEQINLYPLRPLLVFTSKSFSPYNDQITNASKNFKASTGILFHAPVSWSKQNVCPSFCPLKLIVCIDFWFLVDKIWKPSKFFNHWCTFKCSWIKDNVFVHLTLIKKIYTCLSCRNHTMYTVKQLICDQYSLFTLHIAHIQGKHLVLLTNIFCRFLNKYSLKNSELSLQRVSEEIDKLMVSIKDFTDSFV